MTTADDAVLMPWDRQQRESLPAWEAFQRYRDAGAARSTAKVALACGKQKSLMDRWSRAHHWVLRCQAYDRHQDRIRQQAAAAAAAEEAARWERERARQREQELKARDKLFDRALLMLEWPLQQRETDGGRTVINPARWSLRDAAQMADVASRLGRLATGMDTEQIGRGSDAAETEALAMLQSLGIEGALALIAIAEALETGARHGDQDGSPPPADLPAGRVL